MFVKEVDLLGVQLVLRQRSMIHIRKKRTDGVMFNRKIVNHGAKWLRRLGQRRSPQASEMLWLPAGTVNVTTPSRTGRRRAGPPSTINETAPDFVSMVFIRVVRAVFIENV